MRCSTPAALSGGRSGLRAPRLWSRSGAGRATSQVNAPWFLQMLHPDLHSHLICLETLPLFAWMSKLPLSSLSAGDWAELELDTQGCESLMPILNSTPATVFLVCRRLG